MWCGVRNQLSCPGQAEGYSLTEQGVRSAPVQGEVKGKDVDTKLITGVRKF